MESKSLYKMGQVLINESFLRQQDDEEARKTMRFGDDVIYKCPMRKNAAAVL